MRKKRVIKPLLKQKVTQRKKGGVVTVNDKYIKNGGYVGVIGLYS